jgi:subtilase family serine protease
MRKQRQTCLNVERLEARQLLTGYTPAQISHAYGFDQWALDGSGQTIAIVDAYDDPNIVSDLKYFDQYFGLPDPPSFVKVNQSGGTSFPKADRGWSREITLDVEWAHAIAPQANILLVEANSNYDDLYTAVDFARRQPGVVTVSMSFGGKEGSWEANADNILTTPAGHIGGSGLPGGITFVASTGDSGAPAGYPAYSPNVLAVGGTSLTLDDAGNYLGESGWSKSGGGISTIEPEPAYQYSVQNTGARTCPDVSYNADPNTGFWIYDTMGYNGWQVLGGTSAGAPQWAALMALVDQARAYYLGAGSLDGPTQTLPAIYSPQMSSDFYDVTTGSNGYSAGPGYDLVTGLGSPYAPSVIYDLAVVGFNSPAPAGAAQPSQFETLQEGAVSAAVIDQLQAMPASKSVVDALFVESGVQSPPVSRTDLQPVQTVLSDLPAANEIGNVAGLRVGNSTVESVDGAAAELAMPVASDLDPHLTSALN